MEKKNWSNDEDLLDKGKNIIRKEGINFSVFKRQLSALFTKPSVIGEDEWVEFYKSYAYSRAVIRNGYVESVEEWANSYFQDWKYPETRTELKIFDRWYHVSERMPPKSIGLLVFIPDEDNHVTSGMWDVDNKWVLLDEYRTAQGITQWRLLSYLMPKELI